MDIKIDSRTLTTALAVNMGMLNITDLVMITRDDEFKQIVEKLVTENILSANEAEYLIPFFDAKSVPMDPVCSRSPYFIASIS